MSEIKKFASALMGTKSVKLDATLNEFVWAKGVRNVPFRVRVVLDRKRADDEDAEEKMVTQVSLVKLPTRADFKNLLTKNLAAVADAE